MKLIATLVLMAGLVGCDGLKDNSEAQVKQQVSYAQIITAVLEHHYGLR